MKKKNPAFALFLYFLFFAFCSQWVFFYFSGLRPGYPYNALLPGLAVLGASFLISWAAELAELEISQGLAIALLALITVLPEYAVDMSYAWIAGKNHAYAQYAAANMTGANRLLIGLGWSAVVFVYWLRTGKKEILMDESQRTEIRSLLLATLYSFVIFLKHNFAWYDAIFLISIYIFYIMNTKNKKCEEEAELEKPGPVLLLAGLPRTLRNCVNVLLFLFAGFVIALAAEPFARGLVDAGKTLGIEQFLLVQWVAPLASEAPEFIVALILAFSLKPGKALRVVISSKINQWTLLIGMLPLVYGISSGNIFTPLLMDARQAEEMLLTSAQSIFALIIISNLSFSLKEALVLFILFVTQMFFPNTTIRYYYCAAYLLGSAGMLILLRSNRKAMLNMFTGSRFNKSDGGT